MDDAVGLHWAGKGWIAAVVSETDWTYDHHPSVASAWNALENVARVLVTTPIGLPSAADGRRMCDRAAARMLGPQQSSVFYVPLREAVYELSLPAAKERNATAGYGIQNGAWARVPRMRELDEFLESTPEARDQFRETHPEVCFHALAGGGLEHSRRTVAGIDERESLLGEHAPDAFEAYETAVDLLTTPRYAPLVTDPGDVLAAFVAAITARRIPEVATLPHDPPRDERGLPMEIVYPGDARQLTLGDIASA